MEPPRRRGIREFFRTSIGRTILLALGIGVVFGTFYISVLLAIPAILIVGLWLPIYSGLKRPSYLALSGLVILLLVAPFIAASFTTELLVPLSASNSAPAGVDWGVSVGNITIDSQSSQITFDLPVGTHAYNVTPISGYTSLRTGSVAVVSGAVSVPISFSAVKYGVTFSEVGLAGGTGWSVTIGGTTVTSNTASLIFLLTNGTYSYRIDPVAKYTPVVAFGTVLVDGAAGNVQVAFDRTSYPVTFTESGLPIGTYWTVTADSMEAGSATESIVLELPNGTIAYTAVSHTQFATPGGGTVDVHGAATSAAVPFAQQTYPVTFTESQLPSAARWGISIGGTTVNSTSSTAVFPLANGTYLYTVHSPAGYEPVSGNNTISVLGGPNASTIVFNATTETATFAQTGLVGGTPWGLTIDSTTVNTTGPKLVLNLSVGSHSYTVRTPPGYLGPSAGSVTISTSAVSTKLSFAPVKYLLEFSESNLASGTTWNVTLDGVTHVSNSGHLEFNLTNGTYPYSVGSPSGKTPPAVNATVRIDGRGAAIDVPFASTTYPVVFSESGLPSGHAAELMQDANVAPFHGTSSTVFTWTANVNPQFLPSVDSAPLWIDLYISSCPGATSANGSSVCAPGYAFVEETHFFCSDPATVATCEATAPTQMRSEQVSFNYTIGSDGIWEWQMGLAVEDLTTHTPTYKLLVGDPTYNGIEGPIVGSYATIFEQVLPQVYLEDFLFLGAPFYVVLLLYAFFKSRERRREDARLRAAGPIPPTSGAEKGGASAEATGAPGTAAGASSPSTPPVPGEAACPNCQAVVYPGEAKCWKCGAPLGAGGSGPLRSRPPDPPG